MKRKLLLIISVLTFQISISQVVNIPDTNFKNALLAYTPVIDTNDDGEIQVTEAENVTHLELYNKNIDSVVGIEAFINLIELNLGLNNITAIDISTLTLLEHLDLLHNDIIAIDFSQNSNLKWFDANFNEFTTLDFSNNTSIEFIQVGFSFNLVDINVENCVNLELLFVGESPIVDIDITSNPNLTLIQAINTEITEIDVSQNPLLNRILISETNIESIDVSQNPLLEYLHLDETLISEVDFSNNPYMYSFEASNCPNLEYINARNGNNFWMNQFIAENNPLLDYICVDDVAHATVNFDITEPTVFTEDCENLSTDYNIIRGRLSFDFDYDGCDPDDIPVPYNKIFSTNGTETYASFANNNGEYAIAVDTGVYNTEVIEYLSLFDATPTNSTQEFADYGNTSFQNFCFTANEDISDVWVYMCVTELPRPGYETSYLINVPNIGSTLSSGTIEFEFDGSKQSFVNASVEPISQTSNSVVFSYTDLAPFQKKGIFVTMLTSPPPTVNSGDLLNFTITAAPDIEDQFPNNNTFSRSISVVNSFDPNDILLTQGEQINIDELDEYLFYTIRFQNTVTASAMNVRITTDLSENLDWNTLTPVESSHNFDAQLTDGNHLEIIYENVNLRAQQDNEEVSDGYFMYKIKPKNDLTVGDIISGNAQIYFDSDQPIITDTITTEIVDELSVADFNTTNFSLYPNPATNQITLSSSKNIDTAFVYDINGRLLKELSIDSPKKEVRINVEELSEGLYFIEAYSNRTKSSLKFIKN